MDKNRLWQLGGYLSASIAEAAVSVVHMKKEVEPHVFDKISPLIENHIGNFPLSMILGIWGMAFFDITRGMVNLSPENGHMKPIVDTIYKFSPVVVVAGVGLINLLVEVQKPGNYELFGDVCSGVIGATLAVGLINLPRLFGKRGKNDINISVN